MKNSNSSAGTDAQPGTDVEVTSSSQTFANTGLGAVKSIYIREYFNLKEKRFSFGVVLNFGRKKADKQHIPFFYLDEKIAVNFVEELKPFIGQTELELNNNKLFDEIIDKYKVKAMNYTGNIK